MSKITTFLSLLFVAPFCFSPCSNSSEKAKSIGSTGRLSLSPIGFNHSSQSGLNISARSSEDAYYSFANNSLSSLILEQNKNVGRTPKIQTIEIQVSDSLIKFGVDNKYISNLIKSHKRAKSCEFGKDGVVRLSYSNECEIAYDLQDLPVDNDVPSNIKVTTIIDKIQKQKNP